MQINVISASASPIPKYASPASVASATVLPLNSMFFLRCGCPPPIYKTLVSAFFFALFVRTPFLRVGVFILVFIVHAVLYPL